MMVMTCRKILVLGATGVVGKVLLDALINTKDNFERIGIFTSAETVAHKADLIISLKSCGVDVITGDLSNEEDVMEAYKGFDTVVSAVGRSAIDQQVNLIAWAERSGSIGCFVPSEYGPFADLYVGCMASDPQVGSFDISKKEATLLGDGKGSISLTTLADLGRLLVAALKHLHVCRGRAIKVNSFTTTPDAILAEFERQTDSKWTVNYTSLGELRRHEATAWAEGNKLASLYTLRRIWTEGGTIYDKTDNELIGMDKMDTLEMVVQEALRNPASGFQSGKL